MFFSHVKNVLSGQDNSKTKLRCLGDVLHLTILLGPVDLGPFSYCFSEIRLPEL